MEEGDRLTKRGPADVGETRAAKESQVGTAKTEMSVSIFSPHLAF